MAFDYNNYMLSQGALGNMGAGNGGGNAPTPVGIFAALGLNLQDSQGLFGGNKQSWLDKPISPFAGGGNKPQGAIQRFLTQITSDLQQCGAMPQIGAPAPADFSNITPLNTPGMGGGGVSMDGVG